MALFSSSLPLVFFLSIFLTITTAKHSAPCLHDQQALLLELKSQLKFQPSNSKKLVHWNNQTDDCCHWDGVECDDVGRVVSLQLDDEAISGGLEDEPSSSLFRLRYLEELNLAHNNINDTQIPTGIHRLTNLRRLNLTYSGFGGQIPVEISELRGLEVLAISYLMGDNPLKLENPNFKKLIQNLTMLRELDLQGVDFSAGGSEWGQVLSSSTPHLKILILRGCNLRGSFHPSLSKLHSLSVLHLDGNNFSTSIPDFFSNFTRLTALSCTRCSLRGSLPRAIFELPALRELDLSFNELLNGTIPGFPLSSAIRSIILIYCSIGGPIPSTIANLTELNDLQVSNNFLTGSIPSFHMSKKVKFIDLSENNLKGSLSNSTFEGLFNLVYLDLGYNSLSGSIPLSLFALPSMKSLVLDHNKFSGQINDFSIVNISSIEVIFLSENLLNGSIPQFLFNFPSLEVLVLSNNKFNGEINHLSMNSSAMSWLDLSSNLLEGPIPDSLFRLHNLVHLALPNNLFDSLPGFDPPYNLSIAVSTLDLSNNRISGVIPSWIWETGSTKLNLSCNLLEELQKPYHVSNNLYVLDLHSNRLKGELPLPPEGASRVDYSNNNFDSSIPYTFFANLTSSLTFLHLANNSLSGLIPTSICNATYLRVLNLSFNRLSGSVPSCLVERFRNLLVLNLRGNYLNGAIPDRFNVTCSLNTFDLSSNSLGGKIPKSLSNCKELTVFNVGGNNFDDSFPCMLSSSLHVLVLRSNRFYGEVKCNRSWSDLQIIDISSNNFSGSLHFLSSLRGMMRENELRLRPNRSSLQFLGYGLYYWDEVSLTVKGQVEVKIVKIWPDFTCIDFSRNNFHGEIPMSIGNLSSLYLLNISHNALTGEIPRSVGNLTELGSLDFSFNRLRGNIPEEIARLTFLSVLNLSYNQLVGKIPNGRQLQTFATDSFTGNEGLCGFPLERSCNSVNGNGSTPQKMEDEEIEWEYVSAAMGYAVGLGSIVWMLLFWRRFRKRYFEKIEQVAEIILEARERRRRVARRRVLVRKYEVRTRQTN